MNIYDIIQADQIEVGDQIIVDGDPIEVRGIDESPEDDTEIVVYGYSHDSGDGVVYNLPFDYLVDLWAV